MFSYFVYWLQNTFIAAAESSQIYRDDVVLSDVRWTAPPIVRLQQVFIYQRAELRNQQMLANQLLVTLKSDNHATSK